MKFWSWNKMLKES